MAEQKKKKTERNTGTRRTVKSSNRLKAKSARQSTRKKNIKPKSQPDYNTPFMTKIIIASILFMSIGVGLAVWSYLKLRGIV